MQVAQVVGEVAAQIPEVTSAYVSPDGLEFVMYGQVDDVAVYEAVADAGTRIQRQFASDKAAYIDSTYLLGEGCPAPGWMSAYQR